MKSRHPKPLSTVIVTLLNYKGGVGKTTIASNLAVQLSRDCEVTCLDLDRTRAFYNWSMVRRNDHRDKAPIAVESPVIDQLAPSIQRLAGTVDFLIIDSPAGMGSTEAQTIAGILIMNSDLLLLPCGATGADVNATVATLRTIVELGAEGKTRLIPSGIQHQGIPAALEGLQEVGGKFAVEVWPMAIPRLNAFNHAYNAGLAVTELSGTNGANTSARHLTDYVHATALALEPAHV